MPAGKFLYDLSFVRRPIKAEILPRSTRSMNRVFLSRSRLTYPINTRTPRQPATHPPLPTMPNAKFRFLVVALLVAVFQAHRKSCAQFRGPSPKRDAEPVKPYLPPDSISVLPILHVPKGVELPDARLRSLIDQHVKWSQTRYRELLGTTFTIESKTRVFKGRYTVQQDEAFENKVGAHITARHLAALGVNRFNCPYVLLHIFHHPTHDWSSRIDERWIQHRRWHDSNRKPSFH